MILTAANLITKIMDFYEVSTFTELSKILNIGQPAITKWKKNNSIIPIKRKCREIGIYDEIFRDEELDGKFITKNLNNARSNELKNSIDENSLYHLEYLFFIAKEKKLLEELKSDLSLLSLKYFGANTKNQDEHLKNEIAFKAPKEQLENYENWDKDTSLEYEKNRLKKMFEENKKNKS